MLTVNDRPSFLLVLIVADRGAPGGGVDLQQYRLANYCNSRVRFVGELGDDDPRGPRSRHYHILFGYF